MSSLYFGAIAHLDEQIGRLLRELETLGMEDNTLVLFTSDHGNMLGDRGRWFKSLQYEGSAHVPLLWRAPGMNGGRVVDQLVDNTSLAPSILEAVGLPVPEGMQGASFIPLLRGRTTDWKNCCFSALGSRMLVDGDWKLIANGRDSAAPFELYDLRNDPKEERNQSGDVRLNSRVRAMQEQLAGWLAEHPSPVRVAGMSTPDYANLSEEERREAK